MIRVLFGPGTAAAANGITAGVDLLVDAGGAGSAGNDFTVNLTLGEGAGTGEGFSAGLDRSIGLLFAGGSGLGEAETAGINESVSITFAGGEAVIIVANLLVDITFDLGTVGTVGFNETITAALSAGSAPVLGLSSDVIVTFDAGEAEGGGVVEVDFYLDWVIQTYGFESDIYPSWWAS
jgi:hypothetical protein